MPVPKNQYLSDSWRGGLFDGKVVFCTGGAGSICSAQVRALVHLGANACIIGRNPEKTVSVAKDIETARTGSRVIGIGGVDVRKLADLQAAVDKCVEELGAIDFVIAGAAGNFLAGITNVSANAFKSVIDIDLIGSYNTVKATLPHLIDSATKHKSDGTSAPNGTGGRIIFVSATLHYGGTPFQAPASAAKAGVDALAVSLCIEQGPRGITSNVIAPGPIANTEGVDRLSRQEDRKASMERVPIGRYGTVKEIADATVFLFSDTGDFVNGETIVVDGGAWHMGNTSLGAGSMKYPQVFLNDTVITGVKGGKSAKL